MMLIDVSNHLDSSQCKRCWKFNHWRMKHLKPLSKVVQSCGSYYFDKVYYDTLNTGTSNDISSVTFPTLTTGQRGVNVQGWIHSSNGLEGSGLLLKTLVEQGFKSTISKQLQCARRWISSVWVSVYVYVLFELLPTAHGPWWDFSCTPLPDSRSTWVWFRQLLNNYSANLTKRDPSRLCTFKWQGVDS